MRNVFALVLSVSVLASGCYSDAHPEYDGTAVAQTSFGPVFVVIDYAFKGGGVDGPLLSENSLRRIEVATGNDSGRLGLEGVNTRCAPAMLDHIWCNSGGIHSLREVDTMRAIADNRSLDRATDGIFDSANLIRGGMSVTPIAHELTGSYFDGESRNFGVHPETLEMRVLVPLEETIDHLEAREWTGRGLLQGDFLYSVSTDGGPLLRAAADDPDYVFTPLNASVVYGDRTELLVADSIDARRSALSAGDPVSVFVVERTDTELRISRVRTDDGTVLFTHTERDGFIHAAAIAGTTFGFVLADGYVEGVERTASVVGLSLETGEELYRIEI